MYLKNGNLVIRSAEVKDAVQLNKWWNDGAVMAHAGFPNGLGESLEDTIAGIKENEEYLDQRCVIEIDDVLAGEMNFNLIRRKYCGNRNKNLRNCISESGLWKQADLDADYISV